VLRLLLNRRCGVSIRNGAPLYMHLIRPIMDYACPVWRSAALKNVRMLQMIKSKCIRLATGALWYVGSWDIHEDLPTLFFADHIRALTESFESKLSDARNSLFHQL